jgi:hypothetical protein
MGSRGTEDVREWKMRAVEICALKHCIVVALSVCGRYGVGGELDRCEGKEMVMGFAYMTGGRPVRRQDVSS